MIQVEENFSKFLSQKDTPISKGIILSKLPLCSAVDFFLTCID